MIGQEQALANNNLIGELRIRYLGEDRNSYTRRDENIAIKCHEAPEEPGASRNGAKRAIELIVLPEAEKIKICSPKKTFIPTPSTVKRPLPPAPDARFPCK